MAPHVDLVVLSRDDGSLHPDVERALRNQTGVRAVVHRVVGERRPEDRCRHATIARARNEAKRLGSAPWVMFVDDDVVLDLDCASTLIAAVCRRPAFGALAADYLGQSCKGEISGHVSMGATLFRREVLEEIHFSWDEKRCECQCCCDDLRRLHWAINYYPGAIARHLPRREEGGDASSSPCGEHSQRPQESPAGIPKVCLVACYMGEPPGWIDRYLISCAYNPTIDFLLVTDQREFPKTPPNVRVERLGVSAFNDLASTTLGMDVALSHPYKLCDFKPLYGHLFEDRLAGCDYWGYTDLDVIYGDLRRRLTLAKLPRYDVFTARREFLVGHFTLFRNNDRMRTLYRESIDYRRTLQAEEVLSFDECGRQWRRRLDGAPLSRAAACDSMTHVVHRMMGENKIAARFAPAAVEWPELAAPDWRVRWSAGRLHVLNPRREKMYFHFHAFRDVPGYRRPAPFEFGVAFDMTPGGFEPAARVPPTF